LKNPKEIEVCIKSSGIYFDKGKIPLFKTKGIGAVKPLPLIRDDASEISDDEDDIPHASAVPHMRTNEKTFQASKFKQNNVVNSIKTVKELSKEIDMFAKLIGSLWNKYLTSLINESINAVRIFRTEYDKLLDEAFSCFIFPLRLEAEYPKISKMEKFKKLVINFPVHFTNKNSFKILHSCVL
jgi:hypothetical protein